MRCAARLKESWNLNVGFKSELFREGMKMIIKLNKYINGLEEVVEKLEKKLKRC